MIIQPPQPRIAPQNTNVNKLYVFMVLVTKDRKYNYFFVDLFGAALSNDIRFSISNEPFIGNNIWDSRYSIIKIEPKESKNSDYNSLLTQITGMYQQKLGPNANYKNIRKQMQNPQFIQQFSNQKETFFNKYYKIYEPISKLLNANSYQTDVPFLNLFDNPPDFKRQLPIKPNFLVGRTHMELLNYCSSISNNRKVIYPIVVIDDLNPETPELATKMLQETSKFREFSYNLILSLNLNIPQMPVKSYFKDLTTFDKPVPQVQGRMQPPMPFDPVNFLNKLMIKEFYDKIYRMIMGNPIEFQQAQQIERPINGLVSVSYVQKILDNPEYVINQ